MEHEWTFQRCREVQENPDGYLDLWARFHHKSSIITFGKTIQDILASHGDGSLTEREVTAVIFAYNRPAAKKFMEQVKHELESNSVLIELFPDVLFENPHAQSPCWSLDSGICVKRKSNPKEKTLEAYGLIDGMPTGGHWLLRIYDDVITERVARNPEMVAKSIESWELSLALGDPDGGRARYIGTRYHMNDAYRTIMDRGAAKPRIHPATDNGERDGNYVRYTKEQIEELCKGMSLAVFGAQMLQNPMADDAQTIDSGLIQRFDGQSVSGNRYLLVDPASEQKKSSDYTVIALVELGADQNLYLIDGIRDRLRLKDRASAVLAFHRKYRPRITAYERYGMQADVDYLKERMDQEGYRFSVTEVGGQMSKLDRIKRLIPYIEEQRLYLPRTLWKVDYEGKRYDFVERLLKDELEAFPFCVHDDMLDALSRIFDVNMIWPKQSEIEEKKGTRYVRKEQRRSLWGLMGR